MTWHTMLCAAVVLMMVIGTWRARLALRDLRSIADRRDGGRP
jgi:hypothetical protein